MRALLTTVAEVVGLVLISSGAWQVAEPLGLIVAGVSLVAVGIAEGRS